MSHRNPHPSPQSDAAEDSNLVQFLRQYRPPVPTAAADLEDQVIQGLPAQPPYRRARTRAAAWASVPVLAASALLMWPSRPLRTPIVKPVSPVAGRPPAETQLSEAELASLGSFLESPADAPSSSQDWLTLLTDAAASPPPHS
jgi:hypothetical protein